MAHRLGALLLCAFAALACLPAAPARADEGEHVFWVAQGRHNTVYLLGSVHLLRADDRALPAVVDAAFQDAEILVEEIDLVAASAEMLGAGALQKQALPEGQTLAQVLGPDLHARLVARAQALHLDPDFLSRLQPWFVAMLVAQLQLTQAGFSMQDGVDFQIAMRAQREGKPLQGLETVEQQLGVLASLPLEEQKQFLAVTLDSQDIAREVREITDAWRRGDLAQLEALLLKGERESPGFYQRVVTDRNRNWLPKIEAMLADPRDDYLVVTGAAHLVGRDGVVEMLRRKGYKLERR